MDGASILLGAAFVLGTILLAWAIYLTMRLVLGGEFQDETETLAGSVIFRVSALHGLILALVFAQELVDYSQLQANLVSEATAIADIYNDIRRYGSEQEAAIQSALSDYTRVVVDEEWDLLAEKRVLSAKAWVLRESVYQGLLDLDPDTPRQEALRDHMLRKIQLIAELRQERENNAIHAVSPLFWAAAIAGIALVTIPYFIFSATRVNLALLSVYGGYSGFVMFIIYAFSDPFGDPGALSPAPFERLLETEIGQSG